MSKKISFKINHILYAAPDKVFEVLTTPSVIEKWSAGKAVFELENQGTIELFDGWVKGNITSFKQGKELCYTWKPNDWKPNTPASLVQFAFYKHPAGTELIITHDGFPNQKEADNHREGWISFVLDPINDYLVQ